MNTPPRKPAHRLLLLAALAALAARFAWEALQALDVFADYHAYYRAAANLRAGADLYAEGKLLVARNSFDFWTQTDGQYVYPPGLAIALLPLTILDIGKGGPVWLLALVLGTLAFIWLAARTLGHPVGLYSYLIVAFPVWTFLPLVLGLRYGLVESLPVILFAVVLAAYFALTCGPTRQPITHAMIAFLNIAAPLSRRSARRDWAETVKAHGPADMRVRSHLRGILVLGGICYVATILLPLSMLLGLIDRFLFALAFPGLVGTITLPLLHLQPRWGTQSPLRDFDTLLPLAIPVLGATPLLLGLRFGQPDILLLLLTTAALLAHLRRRDLLAGVALGAAAAVKPTLALYGLYYLRKRAWGTLIAAALTGATIGLAPFLILGRAAFTDWLAVSRYFTGDDYPTYPNNQALRGLLLRAFVGGPQHAPLLTSRLLADMLWLLAVAVALLLGWRYVSSQRQSTERAVVEYALVAALILVAAPLGEDIHHVALLLPLALLADYLWRAAHPPRWRLLAAFGLLAFILPLPALAERLAGGTAIRPLASAPYLYGLLLVVAALIALLRRDGGYLTPAAAAAPPLLAGEGEVQATTGANSGIAWHTRLTKAARYRAVHPSPRGRGGAAPERGRGGGTPC